MSLTSRVVAVKGVRVGETVGYGARFTAVRPTTLAVVPAGYADGLDRRLEGRGALLVRGRRAPIVGAVSMDMLTVDVTDIEDVTPGDEVTLLGSPGSEARRPSTRAKWPRGSTRFPTKSCAGSARASNAYVTAIADRLQDPKTLSDDETITTSRDERPPNPFSSARNAARSRRNGRAAALIAAPGTRSSRSAPSSQRRRPAAGHRYAPRRPVAGCGALLGDRGASCDAALDRDRRVRPCPRRRHRARLAGAARRRARHREVDAAAAGDRKLRARDRAGAVRLGRGVRASDQVARRSAGRRRRPALPAGRDLHRAHPRGDRPRQAEAPRHRFGADRVLAEVPVGARQHRPGPRSGHAVPVHREGPQPADLPRRPRDEGRQHRRPESARARRRYGAVFRRRTPPRASRRSRGEEPLRGSQRTGRVRDDRQPD